MMPGEPKGGGPQAGREMMPGREMVSGSAPAPAKK